MNEFRGRVGRLKNRQHEIFCQRVAEGMRLCHAYIKAGYAPGGARANASRLAAKDRIACRIATIIQVAAERRTQALMALSLRLHMREQERFQELADRVRRVMEHRAKGESAMETGLVSRRRVAVGSGAHRIFEEREEFNSKRSRDSRPSLPVH